MPEIVSSPRAQAPAMLWPVAAGQSVRRFWPGLHALSPVTRTAYLPPFACALAALVGWSVLPTGWHSGAALGLFMLSAVLLGMPHGALDVLRLWRIAGAQITSPNTWQGFLLLCGAYLLPVGAVLIGWQLVPVATAIGFLLMTAWHWGQNSLERAEGTRGLGICLFGWARGILLFSVPFATHPEEAMRYFDWMGASLSVSSQSVATTAALLTALGAFLAGATLPAVSHGYSRTVEILLLVICGFVLSPLAAIGLFFITSHAWHAHLAWMRQGQQEMPTVSSALQALWPFHLKLGVVGIGCVAIALLLPTNAASTGEHAATVYLQILAALTVPHAWLAWREARRTNARRPGTMQ